MPFMHTARSLTASFCCLLIISFGPIQVAKAEEFRDGMVAFQHKDLKKAVQIWTALAEKGDDQSISILGHYYFKGMNTASGRVIKPDYKTAFHWLEKCTDSVACQIDLAQMYEGGLGVPINPQQAATYYRMVAAYVPDRSWEGTNTARVNLGLMYWTGVLGKENQSEARQWFLLAANDSSTRGQFWAGTTYAGGRGEKAAPENLIEAAKWFLIASKDSDDVSSTMAKWSLKDVEKQLTNDEAAAARRAARSWHTAHK